MLSRCKSAIARVNPSSECDPAGAAGCGLSTPIRSVVSIASHEIEGPSSPARLRLRCASLRRDRRLGSGLLCDLFAYRRIVREDVAEHRIDRRASKGSFLQRQGQRDRECLLPIRSIAMVLKEDSTVDLFLKASDLPSVDQDILRRMGPTALHQKMSCISPEELRERGVVSFPNRVPPAGRIW